MGGAQLFKGKEPLMDADKRRLILELSASLSIGVHQRSSAIPVFWF